MLRKVGLGLLVILSACGSARVIQRTQTTGIIELQGDRRKAMEDAHNHMADHCGQGNYTIMLEGEEPTGTDTVSREDTSYGEHNTRRGTEGGSTTTAQQSTRTATEWRVHYQCGGGGGAPPPGAGGPPPGAGGPPPGGM